MKNFLITCFTVLILTILTTQSSFASTQQNGVSISKQEEQTINKNLTDLGLEKEVRKKLIAKLQRGESWDSMNPEKFKELEKRGTVSTSDQDGAKKVVFPDGSVAEYRISGGTVQCGTGYCNYRGVSVSRWDGVMYGKFLANYSILSGDYNDYISSVYDPQILVVAGSYTNNSLTIDIPREQISYSAQATLRFTGNTKAGAANYYLKLFVGRNMAWQQ